MSQIAPEIIGTYPFNGETNVSIYRTIKIIFHKDIFPGPNYSGVSLRDSEGVPVQIVNYTCDNKIFIDPAAPLSKGVRYTVIIPDGAVKDCAENLFECAYTFCFSTGGDTEPPKIIDTVPVNNSVDVPVSSNIKVIFSEPVKTCEDFCMITLKDELGSPVPVVKYIHGAILTIEPIKDLEYGMRYALIIPENSVCDLSGNPFKCFFIMKFTTMVDTQAPYVMETGPENGEQDVNICRAVTITFNENIKPGTNYKGIRLVDEIGKPVYITKSICSHSLYIKPASKMLFCITYTAIIPENAVQDYSGNPLIEPFSMSYTTECWYCGENKSK